MTLLKEQIDKQKATAAGFLIDGFPREVNQCELFEQMVQSPALFLSAFEGRRFAKTRLCLAEKYEKFSMLPASTVTSVQKVSINYSFKSREKV